MMTIQVIAVSATNAEHRTLVLVNAGGHTIVHESQPDRLVVEYVLLIAIWYRKALVQFDVLRFGH